MYVGTNRIRVEKGTGPELEKRFSQQGGIEHEDGFVSFQMWRLDADEDHDEYLIVTQWESKDAQNAWIQSEAFKRAHSGPPVDFIVGHPESHGYDVRLASESRRRKTSV